MTTTITSPRHQAIIHALQSAGKPLSGREIFARTKEFETNDDCSKVLNYLLKSGRVVRTNDAPPYIYTLPGQQTTEAALQAVEAHLSNLKPSTTDHGNTLLRGTNGREEPIPTPVKAVINDALKPCPEIDAVTREMADQAEIAYQILSEVLNLTPEQMSELTLTDLADTAATLLEDQPPPADVAMLASANRELSMRMAEVIEALHKAPVPFADAIDNDHYLVSNTEAIVAQLAGEQVRASELQEVVIGLRTLLDQVRHTLDLSPAASSMDILAEIENLSRLADRDIQIGARDAVNGPYIIVSDPRGCAGIFDDMTEARKAAETIARGAIGCRAAIVKTVAEVSLQPVWSDAK